MRPLGFGEIVDGAVQLFRRDFGLYYLIVLVCALPAYVLSVLWNPNELLEGMEAMEAASDPTVAMEQLGWMVGQMGYLLFVSLVGTIFSWFGSLSVAVAMADRIEGLPSSLGKAYRGGLGNLPSAAGATVLAGLIFLALQTGVVFLTVFVSIGIGFVTSSEWLVVAGFYFMAAISLLVMIFWLGATFGILPAVVIEGRSATGALRRSFSLCRGAWLRVIGIMTVAFIVYSAPTFAITAIALWFQFFQSAGEIGTISPVGQWVSNTLTLVVGPLTTPFLVGCTMTLFHDRRVRSEGYDLERRAHEIGTEGS